MSIADDPDKFSSAGQAAPAPVDDHAWEEVTGGLRCRKCGLRWMTSASPFTIATGRLPGLGEVPPCQPVESALRSHLGETENAVLLYLAEAYNHFSRLDVLHSSDRREFEQAIHVAQNIVLARPVLRLMKKD